MCVFEGARECAVDAVVVVVYDRNLDRDVQERRREKLGMILKGERVRPRDREERALSRRMTTIA